MKLQLHHALKQTLAPQLIQSLKMLQMPTLKLEQTLRQELSANPMLEEIETLEQEPEEKELESEKEAEVQIEDDAPDLDPRLNEIDWDAYLNDDHDYKIERSFTEPPTEILEQTSATQKTLYDHIGEQLQLLKLLRPADCSGQLSEAPVRQIQHGATLVGSLLNQRCNRCFCHFLHPHRVGNVCQADAKRYRVPATIRVPATRHTSSAPITTVAETLTGATAVPTPPSRQTRIRFSA